MYHSSEVTGVVAVVVAAVDHATVLFVPFVVRLVVVPWLLELLQLEKEWLYKHC